MPTPWLRALQALLLAAIAAALFVVSRFNYLLFHGLVEGFSIVVALSVFVIAWTSRKYLENAFLLIVGVAYLFLGLIELLHSLAFPGMSVFAEQRYQANQLWIAARYLEALTFLAAFGFLSVRRRPNRWALLAIYGTATALLLASVFAWKVFPVCFVPGVGQTPFKIASEYVISSLFLVALALLWANRARFEPRIRNAVATSLAFAVAAELCFTLYTSPYGPSNLTGHLLNLVSYVAVYVALVETCVERPYELVFRELNVSNRRLTEEIETRKEVALAKDHAIAELRAALDEIKTLRGIIPICSHCKKIRDDAGAWSQLEGYIQSRSAAQFSHGLCPDCVHRYYPEVVEKDAGPPGTAPTGGR